MWCDNVCSQKTWTVIFPKSLIKNTDKEKESCQGSEERTLRGAKIQEEEENLYAGYDADIDHDKQPWV